METIRNIKAHKGRMLAKRGFTQEGNSMFGNLWRVA